MKGNKLQANLGSKIEKQINMDITMCVKILTDKI